MTKILDLKNDNDYTKLKEAAQIIKNGGLVLFPTETVYGLGANGLDKNAVKKIYIAKGRNENNPINLLVSNIEMIESIAKEISEIEYKLMSAFFPGPFTIILKKKPIVPSILTANGDTVGVRMPSGIIAKGLVELANVPIAAPSANISGKPSGTNFDDLYNDFKNKVDYMIDGGNSSIGIESTIVKVIDNIPHILRPGSITDEQIEKIAGTVIKDYEYSPSNIPSSNYDHYTLNSKSLLVISNNNEKMVCKINEIANTYYSPVIIAKHENINKYNVKTVIDMGTCLDEIAKNIFSNLRKADSFYPDIVIVEGVKNKGVGLAIMNRLMKACDDFIKI